jgi:hypothetical protein
MGLSPRCRLLGLVGKNFPPCLRLPYFKAFGFSHSYLPWAHGTCQQKCVCFCFLSCQFYPNSSTLCRPLFWALIPGKPITSDVTLPGLCNIGKIFHTFQWCKRVLVILAVADVIFSTSGCPWTKATVKSPVGARRRPLWSPLWVPVEVHCEVPRGCPSPSASVKFYKFYFFLSFTLYLAPALPCKTDRTAGAWVGHVIRCVILKTQSVGLLPLGDESLVSKRSWEASCMSAALKKRDLLFGERFSPFILIHRQNRFCHRKCRGRFCQWIKMQNCRQTHARTDYVNLY